MSILNFKPVICRPHPLFCGHIQRVYKFSNRRGASVLGAGKKAYVCPVIYLSDDPEDFTVESKEHIVDKDQVDNILEDICKLPQIAWPVMHKECRT